MDKLLLWIGKILLTPVFLLINLSWLIAGIWLAWDSAWGAIGWGLLVGFGAPFILAFALIPVGLLTIPAGMLMKKGIRIPSYALLMLAAVLNSFVMSMYFYLIMQEFLPYSKVANPWAIILWTIGVATSGLGYMVGQEQKMGGYIKGSGILVLFSVLGFLFSLLFTGIFRLQPLSSLLISMGIIMIGSFLNYLAFADEGKSQNPA